MSNNSSARFARKVVQDLWFCISTPHLLGEPTATSKSANARGKPGSGTTLAASIIDGGFPRLVDDEWTRRVAQHELTIEWLRKLDDDSSHLTDWILANHGRNFRRLGFYFAALVEYWLRFCQTLRGDVGISVGFCIVGDIQTNIQVRRSRFRDQVNAHGVNSPMDDAGLYVKGHRNSEALGTDVIGALKWYFHIRRPVRGTALGTVVDDELVSVHWEGSIKLFMKVPFDGDIMRPTYMVEGFTQKASAELADALPADAINRSGQNALSPQLLTESKHLNSFIGPYLGETLANRVYSTLFNKLSLIRRSSFTQQWACRETLFFAQSRARKRCDSTATPGHGQAHGARQHLIVSQMLMRGWFFSHPSQDQLYSEHGARRMQVPLSRCDCKTAPVTPDVAKHSDSGGCAAGAGQYPVVSQQHMWGWWLYADEVSALPSHLTHLYDCPTTGATKSSQFCFAVIPKLFWLSTCVARFAATLDSGVSTSRYTHGDISMYNTWAVEPIQQIAEQSCGDEVARWVVEGCPELGVNAAPLMTLSQLEAALSFLTRAVLVVCFQMPSPAQRGTAVAEISRGFVIPGAATSWKSTAVELVRSMHQRIWPGVLHRLRQGVNFENVVKIPGAVVAAINDGLKSPSSPNSARHAADLQALDSAPSSPADGSSTQLTLETFQQQSQFLLAPPLPPLLIDLREAFSSSLHDSATVDQLSSLLIRCVSDSKITTLQLIYCLIDIVLLGNQAHSSSTNCRAEMQTLTAPKAEHEVPTTIVALLRLLKATSTSALLRALATQGTKDKRPIHSLYRVVMLALSCPLIGELILEDPAHASKVVEAVDDADCPTAMEFWTLLLTQWNCMSPRSSPANKFTPAGPAPPFVASPAGVQCVGKLQARWEDLLCRTAGALDHKAQPSRSTSTEQGLQDHVLAQAVSGWDPRPSRQLLKARSTGSAARKVKRTHRKRVDPSAADWAAAGGGGAGKQHRRIKWWKRHANRKARLDHESNRPSKAASKIAGSEGLEPDSNSGNGSTAGQPNQNVSLDHGGHLQQPDELPDLPPPMCWIPHFEHNIDSDGSEVIRSFHSVHGGPALGVCVRLLIWAGSIAASEWIIDNLKATPYTERTKSASAFHKWTVLARVALTTSCSGLSPSKLGHLRDNIALYVRMSIADHRRSARAPRAVSDAPPRELKRRVWRSVLDESAEFCESNSHYFSGGGVKRIGLGFISCDQFEFLAQLFHELAETNAHAHEQASIARRHRQLFSEELVARKAVLPKSKAFPTHMRRLRLVCSALFAFGAAHPRPMPSVEVEGDNAIIAGNRAAKARCVRPHAVWWLDTAPKLRQARVRLKWHITVARAVSMSRVERGGPHQRKPLLIGIDTEWASPSKHFPWVAQVPALVQLCIGRQVWLLDVYGIFLSISKGLSGVAPLQELRGLLSDVFTAPPIPSGPSAASQPKASVVVVGFAFKEDLAKLRGIFTVSPHSQTRCNSRGISELPVSVAGSPRILDVQRIVLGRWSSRGQQSAQRALSHWRLLLRARHKETPLLYAAMPSLKRVAEDTLGATMDKAEQRSDWTRRPLTQSQLHYAALDAVVLIEIIRCAGYLSE